jgi:hypothetical protein
MSIGDLVYVKHPHENRVSFGIQVSEPKFLKYVGEILEVWIGGEIKRIKPKDLRAESDNGIP